MVLPKKSILVFFIITLFSLTSDLSADPWLDQFIIYSDDGRTLEKFPRFHNGDFTIPEGVVEIGDKAFAECSISSLTIPDGVTKIGDGAFALCTSLISIRIPEGVSKIGNSTFYRCYSLVEIELPNSLKEIGVSAFKSCESLVNIEIPANVKNINDYAFSSTGLRSIIIRGENVKIGKGFAAHSADLEFVDLRYITDIKEAAFTDCLALKEVILPKGVDYTPLDVSENTKITLYSEDGYSTGISSYESLFWVNSEGGLNVRDTPGLGGRKIHALTDGTPVIKIEADDAVLTIDGKEGQWTHIQSDLIDGWVFGGYLKTSNTRHKYGESRFIEHQLKERDFTDQDLKPEMIAGKWDISYTNGKPENARPSGNNRNENYLFPYTGSRTPSYSFQIDGSCEINSNSTGTGIGKGTYTMRGSHVRCQYESEPDYYQESGKTWVDNYDILVLDQTHIQIVDRVSIYWYICALDDENLWDKLHQESIDPFTEYVRSMSYEGHTTFSHEETLLMKAAESQNPDAVEWILKNLDTDVNQKNLYGMTALHYAMFTRLKKDDPQLNDCLRVVEILIKAGADINAIDDYRQTPLDYSLYEDEYNRIYNSKLRSFLAGSGGKSSRLRWAELMTKQDFKLYY